MDASEVQAAVGELVDAWCDRRCLRALRAVLGGYPLTSGLTDDWGELVTALEAIRALAIDELTADEAARVDVLIKA